MNEIYCTYTRIKTFYRILCLAAGIGMCGVVSPLQAQIVRVPTKGEIRQKQKEYSGKKGTTTKRSEQPAASSNPMGQRMSRQSAKRNADQRAMLVPVQKGYLDVNDPRNINLNTQHVDKLRHTKNPMGAAMYKQSLKANANAKSMMVVSPAYRKKMMKRHDKEYARFEGERLTVAPKYHKKMMEKRDKQFANFRGERQTLSPEYRKKMYKKRAKEFSSYKGDLLVRKRPTGSYPDMKYRGNRKNSSFERKEKYRKRVLKRMGNKKYIPAHMRRKDEKPTYDTRESEIWDKPR